jgi:hypothetical protein
MNKPNRISVINSILNRFHGHAASYLEIGVNRGDTFRSVNAARKTAVDPKFRFDFKSGECEGVEYHEVESDIFFSRYRQARAAQRFDVIFLDGLHTFTQTLRDLLNSIDLVGKQGIIVIDDTLPADYISSLDSQVRATELRKLTGDSSRRWMGDVYKVVAFIHDMLPSLSYATVADCHGMTVVWKCHRTNHAPLFNSIAEIAGLDYGGLLLHRDKLLNLTLMHEILTQIDRDTAGNPP